MTTRRKSGAAKLAENEFETLQIRSHEVQAQLMADTEILKLEREQFEREQVEALRAIEKEKASLIDRGDNACGYENAKVTRDETIEKLLREVAELRNQIRQTPIPPANIASNGAIPRDMRDAEYYSPTARSPRETRPAMDEQEELAAPRVSFREVLETIPTFNGYNVPVA